MPITYTLFSKRSEESAARVPKLSNGKVLEIAVDSSGLRIVGEGE